MELIDKVLSIPVFIVIILCIGCCTSYSYKYITKDAAPAGYTYYYDGNDSIIKIGEHCDYIRTLGNKDSLFFSFVVDKNGYIDKILKSI